jgi:16S rRNA (cytosine1402-N4)-methyltransferase
VTTADYHIPVLLHQITRFLDPRPGKRFIDATLGGGGHSAALLARGASVLGIDGDPDALSHAREQLAEYLAAEVEVQACPDPDNRIRPTLQDIRKTAPGRAPNQLILAHGNFADLGLIAKTAGFSAVDGILFDLGVSGHQLRASHRGFSFHQEAALDMRLDPDRQGATAADLVNALSEKELTELLHRYGEEPRARAIARAIIRRRAAKSLVTTEDLVRLVLSVYRLNPGRRIHPATRTFQALRIAVNSELENLEAALDQVGLLLGSGGKLAVISFHSLEDRLVKNFLRSTSHQWRSFSLKPIRPSGAEISHNPSSRSAKLRLAVKT